MTLSQLSRRFPGQLVYGEPIITEDSSTVLPVSRVRAGAASAIGIYLIHDGTATWVPAVDAYRLARVGVATGFVAATLSCLAVLRRPPWPDTTIRITQHR